MGARRGAAEWAKVVASWERSGESAKVFAARRGIAAGTLTWWRWRLRTSGAAVAGVRLVPVDVERELDAPPESAAPAARGWELVTRSGVLRVCSPLGAPELSMVIAALLRDRAP